MLTYILENKICNNNDLVQSTDTRFQNKSIKRFLYIMKISSLGNLIKLDQEMLILEDNFIIDITFKLQIIFFVTIFQISKK